MPTLPKLNSVFKMTIIRIKSLETQKIEHKFEYHYQVLYIIKSGDTSIT